MQTALLMVTWFYMGQGHQPRSPTLIRWKLAWSHGTSSCATQLQYDAKVEAGTQEIHQTNGQRISITVNAQSPAPRVSAICAPQ